MKSSSAPSRKRPSNDRRLCGEHLLILIRRMSFKDVMQISLAAAIDFESRNQSLMVFSEEFFKLIKAFARTPKKQ